MNGNEIREKFLSYFERNGHRRVASSPLLPANDPTLLFANAGMNQFKDTFLGAEKRDYNRAVTSQKCLRAGGKHNDLDEVGKTSRHQTFFEMLGNFSFGDYFKEDAIRFAWDFLVNELKLDPERMWFTVFAGDDEVAADEEAIALWQKVGARPERVLRFGRKDNFWQMAETGPCGPNSEINYYLGEHPEDPEFNRPEFVNGPGDTTMEIWNLVFMQYNRVETEPGKYKLEPLPAPSVDTGLGFERIAAVLQGVKSNYDTDIIRPVVEFTAKLADRHYEPDTKEGFAMRVVADHARSAAFSIADNILPGNDGRNYVLRKIMRRAIYQGRKALGFENLFFNEVTNFVVDQMKDVYPELEEHRDFIERMVRLEEERFGSTLTVGLQKLEALFGSTPEGQMPDYKELARLYDTFGTPRDLIRVGLEERGFGVEEEEYNEAFDRALRDIQSTGAKAHAAAGVKSNPVYASIAERVGASEFTGYEETRTDGAHITALLRGGEEVEELGEGDEGEAVLDRTPFYAESGGQVGDTGLLVGGRNSRTHVSVNDTVSPVGGLVVHRVRVDDGESLRVGDAVLAQVDRVKRDATRRNHTATHLMHAALREVLGTHVKQAGSVVAPNYLRFDFTHYQPLTRDEMAEIERLVNFHVLRNEPVRTELLPLEEAMRSGAMALFGEKYAGNVRVLSVPGEEGVFSKELCGGTHVRATGDIGLFKITSDESIASGTRRIRAVTGQDAFLRFQETEALVDQISGELRATRNDIPVAVSRLQEELKKARREADELRLKLALGGGAASSGNGEDAREVEGGVTVLAREASDLDANALRQLSDTLLAQLKSGVVILGRRADGKASLIVRTSTDLAKRVPAGRVIKELAPIIGGRGGGKPDMAEGGGPETQKLSEALEASYRIVERLLTEQAASA
ncbi:MAG TPA: alanine--tRNA ligase [Pyrinomonadaceae bacterium]|jgi:alanyl-tRNA synthetase|nr:alanine--tRNA ligase [Pyrinomonadaceae bacterium]